MRQHMLCTDWLLPLLHRCTLCLPVRHHPQCKGVCAVGCQCGSLDALCEIRQALSWVLGCEWSWCKRLQRVSRTACADLLMCASHTAGARQPLPRGVHGLSPHPPAALPLPIRCVLKAWLHAPCGLFRQMLPFVFVLQG
jgi:hypothetical protein